MSLKYLDITWYLYIYIYQDIGLVVLAVVRNSYDNRCRDWQPWPLLLSAANVAMRTVIACWKASEHAEVRETWNHYVQSLCVAWEKATKAAKATNTQFPKFKIFLSSWHLCRTEAACDTGVISAFAATILLPRVEKAWGALALSVKGLHRYRICKHLSTKGTRVARPCHSIGRPAECEFQLEPLGD